LEDKLDAVGAAGFDGVEIFENDLIASSSTPAEVQKRCADLGLSIDLYQPFRDFDTTSPDRLTANLRRADARAEFPGVLRDGAADRRVLVLRVGQRGRSDDSAAGRTNESTQLSNN